MVVVVAVSSKLSKDLKVKLIRISVVTVMKVSGFVYGVKVNEGFLVFNLQLENLCAESYGG